VEGDREIGVDDCTFGLARRGVDTRWEIDRHHGGGGHVDPLDDRCRFWSRSAPEARPEERVDHDVVRVEPVFGLVRDVACLPQQASGHAAVSAVRPTAADAGETACPRIREHRLACDRDAGPLHQLRDRFRVARIPLLRGAHLRGRIERREVLSHRLAG
jgi:hypothetical protein